MSFNFSKCFSDNVEIKGLYEIYPKIFGDKRGFFFESYNEKDFFEAGLTMKFVQDNQSFSVKGVLRGLHFQKSHTQGKLVRAILGKVFDVAVDLRNDSPTFGKSYSVILDSEKCNQFYVPEGFAHGFYVLSDNSVFTYRCTNFYTPTGESGLMWNDKTLGINWPVEENPVLSAKDCVYPEFDFNKKYFDMNGCWIGC